MKEGYIYDQHFIYLEVLLNRVVLKCLVKSTTALSWFGYSKDLPQRLFRKHTLLGMYLQWEIRIRIVKLLWHLCLTVALFIYKLYWF